MSDLFLPRLVTIKNDINLAENFSIHIGQDMIKLDGGLTTVAGRFYFQIQHWRKDVITGKMGWGYGGKAYLSPHASDSELIQTIFGLYKSFWEHEARETFMWRGRRIFSPHLDANYVWTIARHVDLRQEQEDQSTEIEPDGPTNSVWIDGDSHTPPHWQRMD